MATKNRSNKTIYFFIPKKVTALIKINYYTKAISLLLFFLLQSLNTSSQRNFVKDPKPDTTIKTVFQLLRLQNFEDNLLGYTYDSDDKPFMDITLSAQVRIYPFDYLMKLLPKKYLPDLHLHFALTGRFGQYIDTRYSSPLIGKRFNPFFFLEYSPKKIKNTHVQLGYGHESNGQALDDSATFFKTAEFAHNTINETIDYVSRGWDYVGTTITKDYFPKKAPNLIFETGLSVKYYLDKGFFQGSKEEYYSWERAWSGANYTRNDVSGISATFTCFIDSCFINKLHVNYETGIAKPFFNNSIKLLLGFKIGNFPLALTYRYGYNGDLAQFGKVNSSYGITAIIPSFDKLRHKR